MASLQFDEATHTYTLGGRVLPSVTSVLSPLSGLEFVPADVLERKRIIGQHVHRLVELDAMGNLDESTVHSDYAGYLKQWRKFAAALRVKVVAVEQRVHSAYGYAGTFDLYGLIGGVPTLIDVKTGEIPKTVGPQTAAYLHAAFEMRIIASSVQRGVLQLHSDDYKFKPINTNWAQDFEVFAAALTLHNWRQ